MRRDDLRASRDKIVRQSHALPIAVVERSLLVGDPGSVLNGRWDRVPKLADQVVFSVPCAVYISSRRQGDEVWCVYGRVVVHDGGVVVTACSGGVQGPQTQSSQAPVHTGSTPKLPSCIQHVEMRALSYGWFPCCHALQPGHAEHAPLQSQMDLLAAGSVSPIAWPRDVCAIPVPAGASACQVVR
jgi:hypothetical protein